MSVRDHALAEIESSRRRFLSELEGVGDADFARTPARGGWSVAHVAQHISLSETAIARGFTATLSRARPSAKSQLLDPLRRLLWTFQVYQVVRVRTTTPLDPQEPLPRAEALARLATARETLLASVGDDPVRLSAVRLRHPIFGPLSGDEMLRFVAVHEERHRNQIVRIRAALAAG